MTSQTMSHVVLPLHGVDCGACAEKVMAGLRQLDGVDQIEVQIQRSRVRITFESEKLVPERIESRLRDLGFDVAAGQLRTRISVPGMC